MTFKAHLKEHDTSVRELALTCGIPYATLYNNIEHPETMRASVLRRICQYLETPMEEVLTMLESHGESLLTLLLEQKRSNLPGNIYHKTQVLFAYNSNRIEGSRLSEEETRLIFETHTLLEGAGRYEVNDVIETMNHFYLFDQMLEACTQPLSEALIKRYHAILKNGTSDSRHDWFNVGEYKRLPNEVGGNATSSPEQVAGDMGSLMGWYNSLKEITLDQILEFHYRFELIHPFQDGNGRIGRLIMYRECLRLRIMPFIIEDSYKAFYYRGLAEFSRERGPLRDTCLSMQDRYRELVDRMLPGIALDII